MTEKEKLGNIHMKLIKKNYKSISEIIKETSKRIEISLKKRKFDKSDFI